MRRRFAGLRKGKKRGPRSQSEVHESTLIYLLFFQKKKNK